MTQTRTTSIDELVNILLSGSVQQLSYDTISEWFSAFNQQTRLFELPIDRAILGGRMSTCLGFAFAAAYQSAIEALFKPDEIVLSSFCVTEKTGNHPRAIETTLSCQEDTLLLNGSKSFVSGATDSSCLYIACRDQRLGSGFDEQGRPLIKMLKIPAQREGLNIQTLPALGFVPEVSHGSVSFENVVVTEEDILLGDGYLDYVKAFRTYEDLYVLSAVTAYRLAEAVSGKWPPSIQEKHISLILALRSLSSMNLLQSSSHIALAACRTQFDELIQNTNALFKQSDSEAFKRWERDQVLLTIAKKAHLSRTQKAWELIA